VKAIAACVLACATLLVSACGHMAATPRETHASPGSAAALVKSMASTAASQGGPRAEAGSPVRFTDTEYYTSVVHAGSPLGYVYFSTMIRDVEVAPSSAARVRVTTAGPPRFASPADRARWQAAGKPPISGPGPATGMIVFPPGQYTFMPQGANLTFAQARSLPASASPLGEQVMSRLRAYAGPRPPVELVVKDFAFLLATAPLTSGSRAAAWTAMASLQGLHRCGTGTDLAGRHGQGICATSSQYRIRVLVSAATASVLSVQERITRPSRLYPGLPAHTLIQSDTFTRQP
jgi:hypothetical protein